MDMFMDKLAQKLTAQEIIKANTAAEVEELNKLRNRVAEYNECLDRLQQLIENGEGKLAGAQVNGEEINRLVAESIAKIKGMQQDATALEQLREKLAEQLEAQFKGMDEKLAGFDEKLAGMDGKLAGFDGKFTGFEERFTGFEEKFSGFDEKFTGIEEAVQGKLDGVGEAVGEAVAEKLQEKLAASDENVHKECVKVYRNVQAVITENGEQQSEMIGHVLGKLSSQKARIKIVMGVTVATLIMSLGSIILQIISMANIKLF